MKIIVHECLIDQPEVGSEYAHWFPGSEIRIFIAHIVSYEPTTVFLKKKRKQPKVASFIVDINKKTYFVFESPKQIDLLIDEAIN